MSQPVMLLIIIAGAVYLFITGKWRYDVVALAVLLSLVAIGAVPASQAFNGFANPAVVTVACVMILTAGITQSGIVDVAVRRLEKVSGNVKVQFMVIVLFAAVLSAFMNNVGALMLMMPVAIQTAIKHKKSPAMVLMPLAFGSVLGGLGTAIGTPPNLLISAFREEVTGEPYRMFQFAPVGAVVAGAAILFVITLGWKLTPYGRKAPRRSEDLFELEDYVSEISVPEDSPLVGLTPAEIEEALEGELQVVALIRGGRKRSCSEKSTTFRASDVLVVQGDAESLEKLVAQGKVELEGGDVVTTDLLKGDDTDVAEAVVPRGNALHGRSWQRMRIRSRYGINLLAIAREGKPFRKRLNHVDIRSGDVLLLQGETENLADFIAGRGLLPLVARGVDVGRRTNAILPLAIFAAAILAAAVGVAPVQVTFCAGVVALVVTNVVPVRRLYESVDWSVIVLLGGIIPLGTAMQTTGATEIITGGLMDVAGSAPPFVLIGMILVITMTLSDLMNNAATSVVMAPIAVQMARNLDASIDPFLMAVAVGASCSFLTPFGHQNNTLVMGPGGYRFGDYLKLGIPIEIIVVLVGVPMIMVVWPL